MGTLGPSTDFLIFKAKVKDVTIQEIMEKPVVTHRMRFSYLKVIYWKKKRASKKNGYKAI